MEPWQYIYNITVFFAFLKITAFTIFNQMSETETHAKEKNFISTVATVL